ncbi:MAG: YegS/Rv2252/BmrU family lipid kinase [Clostridiaceae bacterium]|nr:YegS/Rv2252/BmrU family lipid kinase [Clostridiaceae bacterium]
MKKAAIVFNPCAGLKRANKYIGDIQELFKKYGYENNVYLTEKSGDGTKLTKEHAQDVDIVVCIGGDGTLNEVISGMLETGVKKPIGYIPAGSTNDFASSLKLARDIMKAARDIMEGKPQKFDVGCFNGRYFSYIASCGVFTKASYSTPQPRKNIFGHLAYVLEGIKEIPHIQPVHLRVEANGQIYEDNYLFAGVCNSTSVGGILTLDSKKVNMNDGKFELILIKTPGNIAQLGQIIIALKNQDYETEMIEFCSAESFIVHSSEKTDWTLDGEYSKGSDIIEIKNLHNAVEIIVNER